MLPPIPRCSSTDMSAVHGQSVENNGLNTYGRPSRTVHISGHQQLVNGSLMVSHEIVTKYSTYNHEQDSMRFISFRYAD